MSGVQRKFKIHQTCSSLGFSLRRRAGPVKSLLQCRLSIGSQPPLGVHLLQCGVLLGLQVDICSTVDLPGLQRGSLLNHGLHHRLQGKLLSTAWSTSSSFLTATGGCGLFLSHTLTPLFSHSCSVGFSPPFLNIFSQTLPQTLSLMSLAK